jgi:hypothetical protein
MEHHTPTDTMTNQTLSKRGDDMDSLNPSNINSIIPASKFIGNMVHP